MPIDSNKYPTVAVVLASEEMDSGIKEGFLGLLMGLGLFMPQAQADYGDFQKAIQKLDGLKDKDVSVQVQKNTGGQFDLKVGDYHVRGRGAGGGGGAFMDVKVVGPKHGGKGLEQARAIHEALTTKGYRQLGK